MKEGICEGEEYSQYANYDTEVLDNPSCVSMMIAARFMLGLTPHIGLTVVPEYMFRIAESPGHKLLTPVSPIIDKWSKGFNLNMFLTFYF